MACLLASSCTVRSTLKQSMWSCPACIFRLFHTWRPGESTGLGFPSVPHMCFLALPALSLSRRNFLPPSFICFGSRHWATAMLLATVESEWKRNWIHIWNQLLPCQPNHGANWGHFYPSLPGLRLEYFFSSYGEQSKHSVCEQAGNLKM